jgi:hypothetical protein
MWELAQKRIISVHNCVGFEVPTALSVKTPNVWDVSYRAIGLVLDFIHRLVYGRQNTTMFRRLDLSPSSGGWGRINLLSWAQ